MLVFVLNQAQKASTGKIQTPVYENVREFGFSEPEDRFRCSGFFVVCESFKSRRLNVSCEAKPCFYRLPREVRNLRTLLSYFRRVAF